MCVAKTHLEHVHRQGVVVSAREIVQLCVCHCLHVSARGQEVRAKHVQWLQQAHSVLVIQSVGGPARDTWAC